MISHKIIVHKPVVHQTVFTHGNWRPQQPRTKKDFDEYVATKPDFKIGQVVAYDWQFPNKAHKDVRSFHVVLRIREYSPEVFVGYQTRPNYLFLMGLGAYIGLNTSPTALPFSRWDDGHNLRPLMPEEEGLLKDDFLQDYIQTASLRVIQERQL